MILDGWGIGKHDKGDVIFKTPTPYLDYLTAVSAHSTLQTCGEDVGLPNGQMGNSEVGHLNIGAGRVVYQDLVKINKACESGDILKNQEIINAYSYAQKTGKKLHLMGLTSTGGVHSSLDHLFKLIEIGKEYGLKETYVHCFMDGRDTDPKSGKGFIEEVQACCDKNGAHIASIVGRFYAMDRDNRWERVSKAYNAFVNGEGIKATDAIEAVKASYKTKDADGKYLTDEFVMPTVLMNEGRVEKNDSIIFFNFRPDRAREITRTFTDDKFTGFERPYFPVYYVCMTQYDATMPNVEVAFKPEELTNTLGEYLAANGKKQLRIAETEKYAHVTFFFNGGVETVNEGEDRILVPSPKVTTYDLKPEMSAPEVTDKLVEAVLSDKYDVIIVNFANCDMVGHTGVFDAAVKAVETVDTCVGRLEDAVLKMGGAILLTADHGNADKMYEPDGSAFTAHTTNPVPFALIGCGDVKLRNDGRLCDLSPTILKIMDLPQPKEMTGKSLIID